MIDLRSDTVTRPTEAMRRAMASAEVGDDVYGEDPTVRVLEERVAELLGKEAAVFTATGSLANVLAVRSLVGPGEEVLCQSAAHIARAELGAHGFVAGLTMRTWTGRPVELELIDQLYSPDISPYFVPTRAVSVENTHNFSGGAVTDVETLRELKAWAQARSVAVHLDGARLWNAHVATGTTLADFGATADVVAVCLSKGLGAPVGSLLAGSAATVEEARVWRKRLGGGMRQVGVLAAAGLHALDHHIERLADDQAHARLLAEACGVDPGTVASNIVVIDHTDPPSVIAAAREEGVLLSAVGPRSLRLVTHLDVSDEDTRRAAAVLSRLV